MLKRVDRLVILTPCQMNAAQSKETVRILVVQLDGPLRRFQGIVHPHIDRRGIEIYHAENDCVGQSRMGAAKTRIHLDGLAKQFLALQVSLPGEFVEFRNAKLIKVPSTTILARPSFGLFLLAQTQLCFDAASYNLG